MNQIRPQYQVKPIYCALPAITYTLHNRWCMEWNSMHVTEHRLILGKNIPLNKLQRQNYEPVHSQFSSFYKTVRRVCVQLLDAQRSVIRPVRRHHVMVTSQWYAATRRAKRGTCTVVERNGRDRPETVPRSLVSSSIVFYSVFILNCILRFLYNSEINRLTILVPFPRGRQA